MATVKIKYLLRKDGALYYQRGVPVALRPHYSGRPLIRINLQTQDLVKAAGLCAKYALADDVKWRSIHDGADPEAAAQKALILRVLGQGKKPTRLTDALERYLSEHRRGQDPRFARDARRAIDFVTGTIGNLPLDAYSRDHARAVRDALSAGHVTATVRRSLDSIVAIFNFGRREFDVTCSNPFEKMQIPREGLDATKRLPFTQDERETISQACRQADDDIRWIVAIQLATGARLGEIVGLRRDDVILDHAVPHLIIRRHEALGRTLKTPGSERLVPLLGLGLWAAERAMAATGNTGWIFPRYCSDGNIRGTHASNTVNKWLRETLGIPRTTHSARHSMKDLLRNSGCSEEIAKALLGHGTRSVADSYGVGFSLDRLHDALLKVALS